MGRWRHILCAAALLTSGTAFGADLGSGPPPAPLAPVPVFTWTGFYVGVNAGGAWNTSRWSSTAVPSAYAAFNTNGSGFTGGGQVGYNYQINQFVFGLEGDLDGVSLTGKAQCDATVGSVCNTRQNSALGSINGRIGVAFDRVLAYATGGIAFTNYRFFESTLLLQSFGSGSRSGPTVGVGLEYALTNNLIAGVQWNYYDFGSRVGGGGINPTTVHLRESENAVVARLSWLFGASPAPVVAKY